MPNKPKKGQPVYGRGGGGGGWLQRLLAGGSNVSANEEVPEDILSMLGEEQGYVSPKGQLVSQPYSDTRGILAKAAGAPNRAEELNTELQQAQLLQRVLMPGELNKAEQLALIQALGGILRSDTEGVSAFRGRRVAEQGAGQKKAEAEGEEATSRAMIERETRTPRRRIAQQTAQRGVAESTRQAMTAMSGEGQQAIEGRYLAEQLAPIFNLRKAATIGVSPGEVSQFSGVGLPDQLQKILGPGFTARGTTYNEQPILGQPIGKSGLRAFLGMGRNMQPGNVYPYSDTSTIKDFLGQGQEQQPPGPSATPRATGEQFGPFLPSAPQLNLNSVGMPSMGPGGVLSAPLSQQQPQETPEQALFRKQREAKQAQELLQRLLQQGTPFTPNYRNF